MLGGSLEEKIRRLKSDPVVFAEAILGFKPFEYQKRLLRDPSKRIVACMGRQTGKSTTIAAKAIWFACTHPNTTTLIVSATLRQSMLMMDKILSFIEGSILKRELSYKSRTRIRFRNGSWIIALPCGRYGHTLRGHTAHLVILDEAAFIPEEVISNVVLPMVSTTNGYVWMLSTPWDKDHIFYRAFSDAKGWSVYHLPSSVNPLISKEFLEEQRRLIGEERYLMEYEACFIDDARSFYPMTLIRPCLEDYQLTLEGEVYGGYDPGGREDYAAFVCVRREGDGLRVCYIDAKLGLTYSEFTALIASLKSRASFAKICVDETGLGGPVVEHLRELGLPCEGIKLTESSKERVLGNLKLLLEQRRITLPFDNMLIQHLNAVEFEVTRSGGLRFTHRQGTHDDLAYALALACWAARCESRGGVAILG